ncbi:MAG: SAM-dependent methyltransferase [Clostridium sp.]|nr:SAM-dependent methyltransferase [Clostridium sp.]
MANEAKTSAFFRELLRAANYYDDNDVVIEEQKSDNVKIDKLLKNASKRGNKRGYPDFILYSKKFPELIIVVEAKADINRHVSETMDNYADYAVDGALLYASFLAREFDVLAIGVSGEEKDKLRLSHYLHLKEEKTAYPIFDDKILPISEYFEGIQQSNYKFNQDYGKLIAYTKILNETLHAKKIKESQRALLISGILIALKDNAFKAGYKKHERVEQLVKSLYTAIEGQLSSGDIPQRKIDVLTHAFTFIKTNSTLTDKKEGKKFLEDLIDEIDEQINGFMVTHKYVDTVSQFYIEFLRYANNDKGLGIVLTPPHITELFAELAEVDRNSVILDNCCGTGGFLISAMKKMLIDAKGDKAIEKHIKEEQLIGIEFQDDIYTLLISNMIIHRDGRTNIYWGDCFSEIKDVKQKFKPTVGLLNPPYKTKASDIEEFEFILNNLDALEAGGTCIAIIPISCVIEKTAVAENLKKRVLEKHTLEAVMSMPEELFHNSKVNTVTCAVIITAKKPHPKGKKTWFAYCRDDGYVKMKNKGRIDAKHTWKNIKESWVNAYRNREVIDGFSLMREVNEKDEWCVEAYLETDYSKFTFEDYENTVKKYLMFNMMDMSGTIGSEEEDEDL